MNKKEVILTGDRPTGPLHIGHYFGSLMSRKNLEKDYKMYLMVADVQALTDHFDDSTKVRNNVFEVLADNIALGLDLEQTTIFIQSQIPQIAELTVFYSNLVTVNRLKHNPTVKQEIRQKRDKFGKNSENLTFGFLGYPVSQAADITVVRAHKVPVGADQLPMIEQTRDIVDKFHQIYQTEIFPSPKAILSKGQRIMGLDGNAKMSKSLNNCVYLSDSPEATIKKFKRAKTDSESQLGYDPEKRPELSNLILIYSLIHGISIEEALSDLGGIRYGAFKEKLGTDLNAHLAEFRERRAKIAADKEFLRQVIDEGRRRVMEVADETLDLVREAMSINY